MTSSARATTHEARQVLNAACAGDRAERLPPAD